jgi:integrase
MSKILTAKAVEQIKPGKSRREISDGQSTGLYLHVQPTGSKSWVMLLARPNGQLGKLRLGPVDLSGRKASTEKPEIGMALTLADARALAAELKRQRDAGKDFIAEHKAVKQQKQRQTEQLGLNSFAVVAQQFIDEHARPETRRWQETARYLGLKYEDNNDQPIRIKGGLAVRWRDREISSITGDEVHEVIDEARRRGIPGRVTRNHSLSNPRGRALARVLSKFFGWCVEQRKIKISPSVGIKAPRAPRARDRTLSDDEVVRFWNATDQFSEPFGSLLRILLLTGARLREVSGMRVSELSKDGATWTVPAVRVKNRRDHMVPLSPLACSILGEVKQVAGKPGFVFSTTGETPVNGFSKIKVRLDQLMTVAAEKDGVEIPPWRLHDLRRSAATIMANIGVAPHIIEAVLNHVSGARAGVAGVYNRAEYGQEKRVALERLAAHIEGLVKGRKAANVTPLRKKRRS